MSDVRQLLSRDPIFKAFLAFFVALHSPYIFPLLTDDQLSFYSGRANLLLLPATMVAILLGLRSLHSNVETRFWRYLAYGWGVWWLATAIQLFWPDAWRAPGFDVAIDGLFALYYTIWLMAVGLNPHRPATSTLTDRIRRIRSVGTIVLILGLSVYFLLVPGRLESPNLDSWVPSLFLFVVLDLILFTRLTTLAFEVSNRRWRLLYGLLAAAQLMNSYLDLQEGLIYQGIFEWRWGASLDFLWNLPMLTVVAAARLRQLNLPDKLSETPEKELSAWHLSRQSPLVFSAFAFPFLHIFAYRFRLLDESARAAREGVVMVCLLLLLGLILLESNLLFRNLRQAAAQRKELHDLKVAQEVAARSETARSRFLANVSHEIRTPMNGILGISDMLLDSSLSQQDLHRVSILRSSARGLLQLIDDILDFTKIDANELTVERKRFALKDTLEEVMELQEHSAGLKGLSLELKLDEHLPDYVAGDRFRLRQILTNLIANAIKFTPQGHISVVVSVLAPFIRFEVIDSGIGIDEKDQARLFEPFTQVDGSRSRQYGGAGLGLAISHQIVTRLGGEIGLKSQPGEGSCFWFKLPLEATRAPTRRPKAAADPEWEQRPNVLLAEDNPINQMVAIHLLEDLGAEVQVAANGHEVLDLLEHSSNDLILMDCQMPEMDGYEATRRIRQLEQGSDRRIPIIAVTAHAFSDDRARCMDSGMDDYLPKPYSRADLATLLQRWLDPNVSGLDDSWSEISAPPSHSVNQRS